MSKNKVFISHNYIDSHYVNLLKGQLAGAEGIDVTFVSEPPTTAENIEKAIKRDRRIVYDDRNAWRELE